MAASGGAWVNSYIRHRGICARCVTGHSWQTPYRSLRGRVTARIHGTLSVFPARFEFGRSERVHRAAGKGGGVPVVDFSRLYH